MQNTLHHNLITLAKEGVLLTNPDLARQRKSKTLIEQAQQQAKKLLASAQTQAQAIQQQAYASGYQQGLVVAIDAVAFYLTEHEKQAAARYQQLESKLQCFLKQLFEEESVVLLALTQWRSHLSIQQNDSALHVLVPESYRSLNRQIRALLSPESPSRINLEYHAAAYFVMRYKTQLAEFYPEQLAQTYASSLLTTHAEHKKQAQQNQQLSQEAITVLQHSLARHFATLKPTTPNNTTKEE